MGAYIFHVDANSAFLSWSAAYRVSVLGEKTDLRLIPSIVGGDQEKRHGIVLAKSTLAREYDIKTGEAIVTARKKCPQLVVIPPDYGLYVSASRAFIAKLKQYTDQVIQYSIDEAWAVFDGYEKLYGQGQMVSFAYGLKDEIKEELGFTVNIGISTNFLLSKMAGDFSKPDKVHTLFPEEIEKKMWTLPVSDLFFVGKATTAKLHRLGIYTIGELAQADEDMIYAHLKTPGRIIQGYARGEDLQPYMFTHEANKGYGNSLTAPVDVETEEYAKHLMLSLCETVGTRLRSDNVKISVVSVHITTCEFQYAHKQMQILTPTDVTEEIYTAACGIFKKLWDGKTPIRQIGVHTSKVESDGGRQYNLFDMQKYDRLETLNRTVDKIREKYGEDAVFRAGFLKSNVTHMSGGLDKERRSGVTLGIDVINEKVRNL
ncbi:MAG: DNA polymerase IV [Lachnospiraceae bacterium]|nr:DNA polymerase IV [Lachnospiraceae bacterium]